VNRMSADGMEELLWSDLRPIIDEEVNRLPEKWRATVVLCFMEGMSYAEAADHLKCSKGAVALRLEQARDRLRKRLQRRGLALSVGMVPALLTPERTGVLVPPALANATAQAAWLWTAAGRPAGAVPAPIATLAEAGLPALSWGAVKMTAAIVLTAAVTLGTAGAILHEVLADRPGASGSDPAAPQKGRRGLQQRLDGLPPRP
jgi:hypothetical protein